jgi:hypothetical protein
MARREADRRRIGAGPEAEPGLAAEGVPEFVLEAGRDCYRIIGLRPEREVEPDRFAPVVPAGVEVRDFNCGFEADGRGDILIRNGVRKGELEGLVRIVLLTLGLEPQESERLEGRERKAGAVFRPEGPFSPGRPASTSTL